MDWYASDIAQEAVDAVLAPLAKLGGARGRAAHPDAARLPRPAGLADQDRGGPEPPPQRRGLPHQESFALLEVDPENPDDLLLLQLACRARELA